MPDTPDDLSFAESKGLCLGEWVRSLDERYRLSLPAEMVGLLADEASGLVADEVTGAASGLIGETSECVLAKERPGCVSLWNPAKWEASLAEGMSLVASKIQSGRLSEKRSQVQMLGRLLSTRHRKVPIAGRGRIAIPDSFRDFLEVEPGGDLMVVGAAVCIELWQPRRWSEHIGQHMSDFQELFDQLSG